MTQTDQFWQYAKEALLSTSYAQTEDDRQGFLELARTWTQAALRGRVLSSIKPSPGRIWSILTRTASAEVEAVSLTAGNDRSVTSIVPFIGNTVSEAEDIKLMSDAHNNAIEDVYGFGHPN